MRLFCASSADQKSRKVLPEKSRTWFRNVAFMLGSAIWGCSAPNVDYGNCVARCDGADQACSLGKVCREGYCVDPNFTRSCAAGGTTADAGTATTNAGSGTGTSLESGGMSSTATAASGGVASSSTGGSSTAVDRATGGTGEGANPATGGTANGSTSATTGGATDGGTSATTGSTIANGGAAATGGASEPERSSLGGTSASGGTPAVGTPAGGDAGQGGTGGTGDAGPCTEVNTPQVQTKSLPLACAGEVFSAQLSASGGDNYLWTATIPSNLDLTLTKEGKLAGTLSRRGEFSFDVSVTDETTGCTSAAQRVTLSVGDDSFVVCPTIGIRGKPASALAPESCAAWPYAAEFEVSGGTAPFTWQALGVSPGIEFDSTSQAATGNPTASGDLVLQVSDATGRTVRRSFAVTLRDKCWFAYISNETGAQRLHLVDPMLGARLQRPTSDSTDLVVTDFKFSPDGKFIAYRVKDTNDDYSLWLSQAPGWDHEQQINLDGSVTHYAWSNNSQALAAAFDTGTETILGGVGVAGVPNTQTVPGIQGLLPLTQVSAPVQSEITWYGNDSYLAFHSEAFPGLDFRMVGTAAFGAAGFDDFDGRPTEIYDPSLALRSSTLGVYPMVPAASVVYFIGVGIDVRIDHANIAIAPRGEYAALIQNRALNIYSPTASTFPYLPVSALASADDCDTLLGWSEARQRLTCVDMTQQNVVAYDVDIPTGNVSQSPIAGSETYVSGGWQGNRRLMSRSGNWAAFSTADRLYLANLLTTGPTIAWSARLETAVSPNQLSFAPDESLVLAHDGTVFSVFATASTAPTSFSHSMAASAPPCQEDELWADDWCGQVSNDTQVVWSPDSHLLAFVSDTQDLMAFDLRQFINAGYVADIQIAPDCAVGCAGTGRFQP